jgi:hypothetical protein
MVEVHFAKVHRRVDSAVAERKSDEKINESPGFESQLGL